MSGVLFVAITSELKWNQTRCRLDWSCWWYYAIDSTDKK